MSRFLSAICLVLVIMLLASCTVPVSQPETSVSGSAASASQPPSETTSDKPSQSPKDTGKASPSPKPSDSEAKPSPSASTKPEPGSPSNTVPAGIVKNSGVIIGTDVAFRTEADSGSKVISRLNSGTYVQILKTNVDAQWHQVKYQGKTGYVNRIFICLDSSLDGYKLDYVATIVNCKNDVNIRSEPSKEAKILGVAKKGDKISIVPQDTYTNGWYQVDYNGETGFIHANYLDIQAKADDTQLTNLSISGGSLYPSFSPKEYGYVIKTSASKVTIEANANSGVKVDVGQSGKTKLTVSIPSAGMKTVRIAVGGKIRYSLYISRNILTVGTWNIKRGYKNMLMQGRMVYDQQPDIMGIQEVFQNLKASNIVDNLASLKTRGMQNSLLSPTINYSNGGKYGNGILSRYKLTNIKTYKLDSSGYEPRLLQKAVVTIGGKKVSFYNTHFTYNTAAARAKQFNQVKKIMDEDTNKYKILTGDFNADYKEFSLFLKNYTVVNSVDTKYYDYAKNEINYNEIDNIILTKNIKVVNTRIVVTKLSDHCPVFAYLILN